MESDWGRHPISTSGLHIYTSTHTSISILMRMYMHTHRDTEELFCADSKQSLVVPRILQFIIKSSKCDSQHTTWRNSTLYGHFLYSVTSHIVARDLGPGRWTIHPSMCPWISMCIDIIDIAIPSLPQVPPLASGGFHNIFQASASFPDQHWAIKCSLQLFPYSSLQNSQTNSTSSMAYVPHVTVLWNIKPSQ